jgi:ComF family protein
MPERVCRRCATALSTRGTCRGCRYLSPALTWVRAPFAYEGAARRAVLILKFRNGRYLVPTLGELLREALSTQPIEADLIVPVPLASRRLRARGYNQAHLLAEQVQPLLAVALASDLLKRVERPPQQTLTAADRLTNLNGVFWCARPEAVRGKRILIVDDVVTTGATVSACADTLADAGATRVCALAFARDL